MNEGVKIILERMKTNPEEFVPDYDGGTTKWNGIIGRYHNFLTKEESEAITKRQKETVHEVMRERFTSAVMEQLLDPKDQPEMHHATYTTLNNTATTLGAYSNTANVTLNANSMTLGNTKLEETELRQLLEMKKEIEAQRKQTLVGRLHNYLGSDK